MTTMRHNQDFMAQWELQQRQPNVLKMASTQSLLG